MARTKKRGRLSTFSASLTTKQIEWLRSHPKPQEALRNAIDTAMQNSLEPLKKKEAELIHAYRILNDALQSKSIDEKRREEIAELMRAKWEEYEKVQEKINHLKLSMR